jgi:hypothetical protein
MFAPIGSLAKVAANQASKKPAGISASFLSSGTPVYQRVRACSRVMVR